MQFQQSFVANATSVIRRDSLCLLLLPKLLLPVILIPGAFSAFILRRNACTAGLFKLSGSIYSALQEADLRYPVSYSVKDGV